MQKIQLLIIVICLSFGCASCEQYKPTINVDKEIGLGQEIPEKFSFDCIEDHKYYDGENLYYSKNNEVICYNTNEATETVILSESGKVELMAIWREEMYYERFYDGYVELNKINMNVGNCEKIIKLDDNHIDPDYFNVGSKYIEYIDSLHCFTLIDKDLSKVIYESKVNAGMCGRARDCFRDNYSIVFLDGKVGQSLNLFNNENGDKREIDEKNIESAVLDDYNIYLINTNGIYWGEINNNENLNQLISNDEVNSLYYGYKESSDTLNVGPDEIFQNGEYLFVLCSARKKSGDELFIDYFCLKINKKTREVLIDANISDLLSREGTVYDDKEEIFHNGVINLVSENIIFISFSNNIQVYYDLINEDTYEASSNRDNPNWWIQYIDHPLEDVYN